MVQETFLLEVKPGDEQEFEKAFKKATVILSDADGCIHYELQRCMEKGNKYLVAIEWETVEHHTIIFKNTAAFQKMKALLGPFYQTIPQVEHYKKIELD